MGLGVVLGGELLEVGCGWVKVTDEKRLTNSRQRDKVRSIIDKGKTVG